MKVWRQWYGQTRAALPVALVMASGLALRLWMMAKFFEVNGDSLIYGGIAKNLLLHGRYALTAGRADLYPTLIRLPGYPLLLAVCFRVFGMENYASAVWVQIGLDLVGCLLLADFVRKIASPGAAHCTLWLAALCPFTAIYAAEPLSEAPTLFVLALALWAAERFRARPGWMSALGFTFAVTYAALLRPDGALVAVALAPALLLVSWRDRLRAARNGSLFLENERLLRGCGAVLEGQGLGSGERIPSQRQEVAGHDFSRAANGAKTAGALASEETATVLKGHDFSRAVDAPKRAGALAPEEGSSDIVGMQTGADLVPQGRMPKPAKPQARIALVCILLALAPFAAWTWRNWRVFHVFEPLAPRLATDPDEEPHLGWERWVKSWCLDFVSTYEIYWNVPDGPLDLSKLPGRAFDTPEQYAETANLAADYNQHQLLTHNLDDRFGRLADARIAAHPLRYYLWLPLGRVADMWLRPRVENLPIDLDWWVYAHHRAETRIAWACVGLNAFYVLLGIAGLCLRPRYWPWMLAYMLLRSAMLLSVAAPEARYTLECFPMLFVLGGIAFWTGGRKILSLKRG